MNVVCRAVLCSVLFVAAAVAQQRPDFTGRWVLDEQRSESAHYPEFVGPVIVVITQSDHDVRLEVTRGADTTTETYRIYPSAEAAASVPPVVPSFRSHWEDARLVTDTVRNVNDATVRTKESRALSSDGSEMTVEATVIVEHGYTLEGAKNYGHGRDVYKRQR